jgi:hypothetical protein
LKENTQFKEFHRNKKEMKVMKQKIKDEIKNKILITTDLKISKIIQSMQIIPKIQ